MTTESRPIKKQFPFFFHAGIIGLVGTLVTASAAWTATTASVTATVTVESISVAVTDGSVSYGTLSTSSTASTIAADLNDTQHALNAGNVNEDFNIQGQNSADWTLATSNGTDQYVHRFCTSSCGSPPANFTALTTGYQTLGTNIQPTTTAPTASSTFDLQIVTPDVSTVFTSQSVDVTVQAVAN